MHQFNFLALQEYFLSISASVLTVLNFIITLVIVTLLFTIIFKVLPDVRLRWKPAIVGAIFTTALFTAGKYLINLYIQKTNPGIVFGTAGSIFLLLVWIYYTAIILYFGAEFTQVYAEKYSDGIQPSKYAVHLKVIVEENKVDTLPPQHPEHTQ